MCSPLHASSPAAACGPPPHSPTAGIPIQAADLVAMELHTRADRRRIHRSAQGAAVSIVAADLALVRAARVLRYSRIDPLSQERIAAGIRTALRAHYAALLQAGEIEAISRRMGVER